MKKFKKFMTVFLAIIMCLSNLLSVSATDSSSDTTNLTTPVVGKILFETDFATENPLRVIKGSGNATLVTDSVAEYGQVLQVNNADRIDSDTKSITFTSTSSSIVYEFDVKIADLENTAFNFNVRKKVNGSSKYSYPCTISAGKLSVSNTELATLSEDTWYHISVVQNYGTGYKDVYLNGTKISTDNTLAMENYYDKTDGASDAERIAFEMAGSVDSFYLDNIKIYEGIVPLTTLDDEPTGNLTTPVEGKVLFSTDFATENPLRVIKGSGNATLVTDSVAEYGQVLQVNNADRIDSDTKSITFTSTSSSIVYEFDVKIADLTNTEFNFNVRKKVDGSSKYSYPCTVSAGKLKVSGTELAVLSADTWYHVSVVQNYGTGYKDVYLDGTKISTDNTLAMENYFDKTDGAYDAERIAFEMSGSVDSFKLDNIKIYEGTMPVTTSNDGNEGTGGEEGDESTVTLRNPVEGTKIYSTDFELRNPFAAVTSGGSGTITRVTEDEEHGYVMEIQRLKSGDLRLDPSASTFSTDSASVVYEFDVKLLDLESTSFHLLLRKTGCSYGYACTISNGKVLGYRGTADSQVATLDANKWYTISIVQNYNTMYRDIYIDGVKVSADNTLAIETDFATGTTDLDRVKFECGSTTDYFRLDNVRVYEGTRPHEGELLEKEVEEVEITIDYTKSVFETEKLMNLWGNKYLDTLLEGYVALHTRSGVVYKAGDKTVLPTTPVETTSGYQVVLSEICAALGLEYTVDGNVATISNANNQTVSIVESAGNVWVDAAEFLGIYGRVSIDKNEAIKSNGMMIAGANAFEWPSAENQLGTNLKTLGSRSMLQNLNEYLFLEQPTATEITTLYQSSAVAGQHPRIQATKDDFDRIKSEIETDELMNTWYQQLIAAADYLVNTSTTPLVYEFRDGVRLLYVSRDMLDHMYTLGMAYQLTGQQKYVDRAWADLEAVCGFPDWNPAHSLDTAEMSAAVAIGYDWMYSGLSESQRKVIEKGLYNLSFTCAVSGYQEYGNGMMVDVLQDGNWNVIINSGFTLGALALMDVYPEVSAFITSGAVRAVESMLIEFGPDGAWKEGPNYWEYTMQYAAKMLSSLDSVFGTCFSLDKSEGLSTAGNYILHVQSDMGLFNYGDANPSHYYVPEIFYLADKYENSELLTTLLTVNHGEMLNCEDVVLSLLWYDDAQEETSELPLDGIYWTEGIATFRDVWSDGVTAFTGIHGGKTNVMHSQIDGGTFVYDYAGVRWAREIGMTPYSTSVTSDRSEESGRWLLYNSKAEAHNTLVINPDGTAEQKVGSTAKTLRFESANKGGIAVLDLTENYAANASSAIRGIFFTDDRTSLVVRDEVTLTKENSTIYWFMQTDAEIEMAKDGKSATLTQDGKQVVLDFVTSGNGTATLSYGPSTRALLGTISPLAGTAEATKDADSPDINRIAIKLEGASGAVTITTKLTPVGVNSTPVSDYNTSIASWSIPTGEIAAKPEVQSVVIDGRKIEFDDANQATFLSVEGTYDAVPATMVTVDETKFTYEVTEAATTDGDITTIVVRDINNSQVITSYSVVYEEIPIAAVPEGFVGTALQVIGAAASAEPEASAGYVAWKVLDQDTDSRWTSQGIGNWILLELEEEAIVDNMIILFKNGYKRATYFTVSVSTDGESFETVYSGESAGTALGSAEAYEQFLIGGKTAKYIKIGCNGNSVQGVISGWNNIGEVVFTGTVTPVIDLE